MKSNIGDKKEELNLHYYRLHCLVNHCFNFIAIRKGGKKNRQNKYDYMYIERKSNRDVKSERDGKI